MALGRCYSCECNVRLSGDLNLIGFKLFDFYYDNLCCTSRKNIEEIVLGTFEYYVGNMPEIVPTGSAFI